VRDAVAGCGTAGATRGAVGAGAVVGARVVVARFSSCGCRRADGRRQHERPPRRSRPMPPLRGRGARPPSRRRPPRSVAGRRRACVARLYGFGACCRVLLRRSRWHALGCADPAARAAGSRARRQRPSPDKATAPPPPTKERAGERGSERASAAHVRELAGLRKRNRARYRPLAARRLPPFWTNICVSG